jgi:hydrogenase maturation factor
VTALLPEDSTSDRIELVFGNVRQACEEAGVTLAGGHTGITVGLNRPILVGCLFGRVTRDRLVCTAGAKVGNALVLAGGIALAAIRP